MGNMESMTTEQIKAKGKVYDNIQNEGGEGYNPYWAELRNREIKANAAQAAKPKTISEQIAILHDKVRIECGSVAREWGNEEIDKKESDYYAEIARLEAILNEKFAAEWTIEITKSRRIEWNNFVQSDLVGGSMTPAKYLKVSEKTKELGWGLDELKKAVRLHKLGPAK